MTDKLESKSISFIYRFFRVLGPAWLVMIADVDVGSMITGIESGALFRYSMIFVELILIIPLFIIQDAAGRVGTASGKGIGELIRRKFGGKISMLATIPMAVTDFVSYLAEYAGISIGLYVMGLPVIPILLSIFVIHLLIVATKEYYAAEQILMAVSALLILFIIFASLLSNPDYHTLFTTGISPFQPYGNSQFDFLIIANIGAVIMPWMLFFQAGATSEKVLGAADIKHERMETLLGAIVSELLMVGMVIVGLNFSSESFSRNVVISSLHRFGPVMFEIFGGALVISGFFALIIISLGSSWGVVESLGFKRNSKENKLIYIFETIPALAIVIIADISVNFVINLMVVFVFVLMVPGILLGMVVSDSKLMNGYEYKKWESYLYWITLAAIESTGIIGVGITFL